ncbi:hypothetical protein [Phormidesmis sp. 146-33]
MQIRVEVPDSLAQKLQPFNDQLSEVLERGVQELLNEQSDRFQSELEIIELLASQPPPEEILRIRPSPTLQSRVSHLLAQSKTGTLSRQEETELDRYLTLEHWVRLAKAHAYKQLQKSA